MMKHHLLLLSLVSAVKAGAQCDIDICGYWYSDNYNSGVAVEYLAIDMIEGRWVCTKILGDAYVPTGHVTWRGVPTSCDFIGDLYGTIGVGQPILPLATSISILSADHIVLSPSGLQFHRTTVEHLEFEGIDYMEFPVSCIDCPSAFPNVFTPNGDGVHDLFEQKCGGPSKRFAITDRWGLTVYETLDAEPVWDGRKGWDSCPEGVYFWSMITSFDRTGSIKRGFVHLFR